MWQRKVCGHLPWVWRRVIPVFSYCNDVSAQWPAWLLISVSTPWSPWSLTHGGVHAVEKNSELLWTHLSCEICWLFVFVILHQNDKMICRAVLEAQYNDTVAILHSEGPSQQRHNKDKTSLCHAAMLMHLTSNNTIIIIITILIKLTLDVYCCSACLAANLCCLNNRLTKPTWDQGLAVQNVKGGSGK